MVDFYIDGGYPETEEEYRKDYAEYLEKDPALSYEDYRSRYKTALHNRHQRLWKAWEQRMSQYVGPCYRFIAFHSLLGTRKTGLFVNIPSTLLVLKQHYDEFVRINEGSFDPEEVIREISNEASPFWNRIFRSSYTIGLLLGYGKRNAFIFEWEQKNHLCLPRYSDLERKLTTFSKKNVTVSDLPLPEFCTFSLGDEKMENYRQQREQIIRELRNQDFEKAVKQWLGMGAQFESKSDPIRNYY